MSLAAGTRLGPYEVLGLIAAGGMGEVYKARDSRLDRTVAIKVLPAELSSDPERRARFEREAKTIAGLTHPHICTLYDVGEHNGSTYLVMEHLQGETLAGRLEKGRLPLDQALSVAREIADALAAAHRQGIIHRDLKPGNVMLTRSGARLLDFGLAKLKGHGAEPAAAQLASMPTRSAPLTAEGAIVGTLQYMAPEQLEGREADARTDVWALGAILYEMLTGRRAFKGESQASIISAIMSSQPPPPSSIEPVTPLAVDRVVQRCLAKDPDGRWQTATDLAEELRWLSSGSGSGPAVAVHTGRLTVRGHRWPWFAAAALLLAVASVAAWWTLGTRPAPVERPQARHTQVTFSGDVLDAALAPDGRTIAYTVADGHDPLISGPSRVLVRDVQATEALEIWRGYQEGYVAWMPDGQQVLIGPSFGGCEPVLVSRFGGTPRRLEGLKGSICSVLAPSPDGSRIAASLWENSVRGYQVLSLASRKTVSWTLADAGYISGLSWDQNSDQLAVVGTTKDKRRTVWVASPTDGSVWRLPPLPGTELYGACWSPVADVLYVSRKRPTSDTAELVRVTFRRPGQVDEEVLLTGIRSSDCQVSADGRRLLQIRSFGGSNLWRLDLAHPATPTPLTTGTSNLHSPDASSDGRWLLATSFGREPKLVRIPEGGGSPSPVVDQAEDGRWSPDGRRLAFVSSRSGSRRIWVADRDGGDAVELPDSAVAGYGVGMLWWPDGRLAWRTPDTRNYRIRDLATGRDELLRAGSPQGQVFEPRVSPNGDQVVVCEENRRDGHQGMWLIGWPDRRERLLAPGDILLPIAWSPNGLHIYALRFGQPEVLRVSVSTGAVETIGRFPGSLAFERCSMTRSGSAIVCSVSENKSDAWVVDDFDPHVPPAGR